MIRRDTWKINIFLAKILAKYESIVQSIEKINKLFYNNFHLSFLIDEKLLPGVNFIPGKLIYLMIIISIVSYKFEWLINLLKKLIILTSII